ncbi:MAG: polyprenyl synthetase family protein [Kiritimatiellia bacterium]
MLTVEDIEAELDRTLPAPDARPQALSRGMRWAVEGGGKRLRPLVCLAAAEAVGGRAEDALAPACAVELLHSYTLVHDDLPAMDNDAERRGKPSVWAEFGEATAILVGDALQALAFRTAVRSPRNVPEIVSELAMRGFGVVCGQVVDVSQASLSARTDPSSSLDFIFEHKTADLFMAAACMGGWAGGGSPGQVERLRRYAFHLGMAFQYEDDLLDGEDGAFSSLCVLSREAVGARVREETAAAIAALAGLPGPTEFLASLARRLIGRKK